MTRCRCRSFSLNIHRFFSCQIQELTYQPILPDPKSLTHMLFEIYRLLEVNPKSAVVEYQNFLGNDQYEFIFSSLSSSSESLLDEQLG